MTHADSWLERIAKGAGTAGLRMYGSYDYIAPQIFRISSTALSLRQHPLR